MASKQPKPIWYPGNDKDLGQPLQPLSSISRTTYLLDEDAAVNSLPTKKNKKNKYLRYQSSISKGKGRIIKQTQVTNTFQPVTHQFVIYGDSKVVKNQTRSKRATSKTSVNRLHSKSKSRNRSKGSLISKKSYSRVSKSSKNKSVAKKSKQIKSKEYFKI